MNEFRRFLSYMKPYWLPVLIGTIALLLSTPAQLFHPLVWRFIVDEVIILDQKSLLLPAVLVMVGVHILGAALGSLRTYLLGVAGQKMVRGAPSFYEATHEEGGKNDDHGLLFVVFVLAAR